jgi:hypothetical protein
MSVTNIGNLSQLINWCKSPSGTGQLTANIFINSTWTANNNFPTNSNLANIASGIIFDGKGYTLTIDTQNYYNTTFNNTFSGLFQITGGIVKNVNITSNGTTDEEKSIRLLLGNRGDPIYFPVMRNGGLVCNNTFGVNILGTFSNVSVTNFVLTQTSTSILCGTTSKFFQINVNFCQFGTKDFPILLNAHATACITHTASGSGYDTETTSFFGSISNCVFYTKYNGSSSQPSSPVINQVSGCTISNSALYQQYTGSIGTVGGFVGQVARSCTIRNCLSYFYRSNSASPFFKGSFVGKVNAYCTLNIQDSYSLPNSSNSLPAIWEISKPEATRIDVMDETFYINPEPGWTTVNLINVAGFGDLTQIPTGNVINDWTYNNSSRGTLPAGTPYQTGVLINKTNCFQNYSISTPNTQEPILSFNNTIWNKSITPPILKNLIFPPFNLPLSLPSFYGDFYIRTGVKYTPVVSWPSPVATIGYSLPLDWAQFNATFKTTLGDDIPGGVYTNPNIGTILPLGNNQPL